MIALVRPSTHTTGARRSRRGRLVTAVIVSAITAVGCSTTDPVADADLATSVVTEASATDAASTTVESSTTAVPSTVASPTTAVAPSTSEVPETVAPTTTETPAPTVPPSTAPAVTEAAEAAVVETRQIGTSVEGRPITAVRRGTPGGRVVLIIGVIHGDEQAGLAIVDLLEQYDVPAGVDLWLVDSMNPDGVAANDRHNANQVDLNRNFPADWGPIGVPGDGQYAGPFEASEPETQAMIAFITELRPDLVMWYHQDLFRISPGTGRDGAVRQRYAELVGLPVVSITGGIYTGVAATWARRTIEPGVAFIVELGATITPAEADVHARAVLTIAAEPI